ncbi:ankyrin repeat domain-containing protein [Dyella tabacisoli]|nr:ankyrin repeat domain-containing protein [Dyella tabacisoli]
MDKLRKSLQGPLRPFEKCPNSSYTLAYIATDELEQDQWLVFRELVPPQDRARLSEMRLLRLIYLAPNQMPSTESLTVIEQMLEEGTLTVEDGQFSWPSVGRLLEILELEPSRVTSDQKAQVARIFFERMLSKAPAEREANLSSLWPGLLHLPEPQLLTALQSLKSKFGAFNPSNEAWQKSPDIDYPLKSADVARAITGGVSNEVVLAMVDLRLPAPPDDRAWGAAIDSGRVDLIALILKRHYTVPLENDHGTWRTPLLQAAQAFAKKADGRALDLLLWASPPPPLNPEVADRVLSIMLFASAEAPAEQRWRYVDRMVALGADPGRLFNDKDVAMNGYNIIDLIHYRPQVAMGLLRHGLSQTVPLQPARGNLLSNYLMVKSPVSNEPPSMELIKVMLKQRNTINLYDAGVGHFPLELAVMNYSPEFGREFLQLGADIRARDPNGYNLLTRAAAYGYLKLVTFLLDAGVDPDEASADGMTALAFAQCKGRHEVVDLLLQRHAKASPATIDCHGAGRGGNK